MYDVLRTAGASAPEASVNEVIDALRRLVPVERVHMAGRRDRAVFPHARDLEVVG